MERVDAEVEEEESVLVLQQNFVPAPEPFPSTCSLSSPDLFEY